MTATRIVILTTAIIITLLGIKCILSSHSDLCMEDFTVVKAPIKRVEYKKDRYGTNLVIWLQGYEESFIPAGGYPQNFLAGHKNYLNSHTPIQLGVLTSEKPLNGFFRKHPIRRFYFARVGLTELQSFEAYNTWSEKNLFGLKILSFIGILAMSFLVYVALRPIPNKLKNKNCTPTYQTEKGTYWGRFLTPNNQQQSAFRSLIIGLFTASLGYLIPLFRGQTFNLLVYYTYVGIFKFGLTIIIYSFIYPIKFNFFNKSEQKKETNAFISFLLFVTAILTPLATIGSVWYLVELIFKAIDLLISNSQT